jgi:hypothetical protein
VFDPTRQLVRLVGRLGLFCYSAGKSYPQISLCVRKYLSGDAVYLQGSNEANRRTIRTWSCNRARHHGRDTNTVITGRVGL